MRKCCPCDVDGICPYDAEYIHDCKYYCSEDREPDDDQLEMGFDPDEGGYTYDC